MPTSMPPIPDVVYAGSYSDGVADLGRRPRYRPHGVYFMPRVFYAVPQSAAAREEPFNHLTPDDWLAVLHHLNAHEIEGGLPEKAQDITRMRDLYPVNTERFFLRGCVDDYLNENNGLHDGTPVDFAGGRRSGVVHLVADDHHGLVVTYEYPLVPHEEQALYEKVCALWGDLKEFEWINVSSDPEHVVWDLERKSAA